MKISPVNFRIYNNHKNNQIKETKNIYQTQIQTQSYPLNYYNYQFFFTGGKSVNLSDTYKTFVEAEQGGNAIMPPDIIVLISDELKNNPNTDKTLIDIHKQKYSKLNNCYDLESVKKNFEEFNGVLSDKDVEFKDDSFFARAKRGEIKGLNKDEDLALQLLKLYWAEALSLNDLKREFNTDLYHTLKKLNIPMQSRQYAKILKLSDKDYNERYTQVLAQKIKEAKERAIQQSEGEPVYIPHGPLSEEHKKHISEGLLKYYSENPEKTFLTSKRQREYYENNPEQRIKMQKVMTFAWHGNSHGNSVLKGLKKYFKKMNVELGKPEDFSLGEKTLEQKKTFKEFWDKNKWAKKEFSLAVKAGWEKVKKEDEKNDTQNISQTQNQNPQEVPKPILRIIPQEIIDKTVKSGGIGLKTLRTELDLSDYDDTKKITEEELQRKLAQINSEQKTPYEEFDDFVSFCVVFNDEFSHLMAISMIAISNDLLSNKKYCYELTKDKSFYKELCTILGIYRKSAFKNDNYKPNETINGYIAMAKYAKSRGHIEFFQYIENMINKTYKLLKEKDDTPQGVKKLHDFMGLKE